MNFKLCKKYMRYADINSVSPMMTSMTNDTDLPTVRSISII